MTTHSPTRARSLLDTIDVRRARQQTPGVDHVVHLNNAGAALPPRVVTEAVIDHLRLEARIGGYEAAEAAHDRIDSTYTAIARLLGAQPDEIAVVENATRAWDMAFYGMRLRPGDRILTGRSEYASNVIAFLQVARRTGAVIEVVDNDEHGQISVEDLRRRIQDRSAGRVALVAVTHVPTQGGLVNPVEEIGAVVQQTGATYLVDACQSVGQLPVDVAAIGCDFLTGTGRKFLRGPRGTGFLYARRRMIETIEPPFLDLHAARWTDVDQYVVRPDARRFENWETNYGAKIGLGVAVDHALSWGIEAIETRVTQLAATLRERLAEIPDVTVHDQGVRRCGLVTFEHARFTAQEVQRSLTERDVNTSVSLVDYARLDLAHRGLPDLVRASPHYYNTEDELDRLVAALAGT
jgi:cysteine desulfurase/selenocysteine lyase